MIAAAAHSHNLSDGAAVAITLAGTALIIGLLYLTRATLLYGDRAQRALRRASTIGLSIRYDAAVEREQQAERALSAAGVTVAEVQTVEDRALARVELAVSQREHDVAREDVRRLRRELERRGAI